MNGVISTILKLTLLCLVLGLALAFFDIDPVALMRNFPEAIQDIFEVVLSMIRWAVPYIMLGAVVVVPIWLVLKVLGLARSRRNPQ